jgi:hypothetical protein
MTRRNPSPKASPAGLSPAAPKVRLGIGAAACTHRKRKAHPCPYRVELDGDKATLCTCCKACEQNCALDV